MDSNITFSPDGWADYLYWQSEDKKTLKRINQLLQDILRAGPDKGLGKPEPLRYAKVWSRRINGANRLTYAVEDGRLTVLSCRGHYEKF